MREQPPSFEWRVMKLTEVVQSARQAIGIAELIGQQQVGSARASSVALHVDPPSRGILSIDVGLVAYRRRLLGAARLWHGFVTIDNQAGEAEFRAGGEYGAEQFAQLSAIPGGGFPPEPLEIDVVTLDVREALDLTAQRVTSKGLAFRSGGALQLLLKRWDGPPTWHIQYELPGTLAVYVLHVDARTGDIMYERLPPGE